LFAIIKAYFFPMRNFLQKKKEIISIIISFQKYQLQSHFISHFSYQFMSWKSGFLKILFQWKISLYILWLDYYTFANSSLYVPSPR
jgi:hypothetical protein